MSRLTRDSIITVGIKEFKIEDLLKTIIFLPAAQVKSFFREIGLTIPREIRMFVLREVLREKVIETRKSRLTLADELNYRLSWFTEFTETQLENLVVFYDDPQINKEFLEEFWTDLIAYMVDKEVPAKDLKRMLDLSITFVKQVGLELPNMKTYNREIKDLFYDSTGKIDGLHPNKFRPVLFKSSTLNEIRDLGSKYDVDVPRRLKKSQLADIIVQELKDRGQHTSDIEAEVRAMSVIVMQRFAIDHDIKASTELKKEEIIEYILANAKETKESYFIPDSPHVYEKEIEEVTENIETIIKIEPTPVKVIVEEIIEEEPKIDEPIEEVETIVEPVEVKKETVYVTQAPASIDLTELVVEVRKLREAVERLYVDVDYDVEDHIADEIKAEKVFSKPIILNSAEFYGQPKSLKKIIKSDETDEREKFIEEKKAVSTVGTGKTEAIEDIPGELRFFGKMFKGLGKFLLKLLKVLLKISLILLAVVVVVFILYAVLTYFVNIPFLDGFSTTINGLFGFNLLDRAHGILSSLFGSSAA